jgi:hypothetical protein
MRHGELNICKNAIFEINQLDKWTDSDELLEKAQALFDQKKYLEVLDLLPDNVLKKYKKEELYGLQSMDASETLRSGIWL